MWYRICAFAICMAGLTQAQGQVIVNGVAGEDADNASPFETLQAAVEFANNGSETVVEIHTNDPIPGLTFVAAALNHPLTIRAGSGFTPNINSPMSIIPFNATSDLVTLTGLHVEVPGGQVPLLVGTTLTANDCTFITPAGAAEGGYRAAISTGTPSAGSMGTLTLNNCHLEGHVGLEVGRAAKDNILNNCSIYALSSDLSPQFSVGITAIGNWSSGYVNGRYGTTEGFTEIAEPRTVTITNSVVQAGCPIGWPGDGPAANVFYENELNCYGPINATNTVFENLKNDVSIGYPSQILNLAVVAPQSPNSTFRHCTFRTEQAWGLWYFRSNFPVEHRFENCIFDAPKSNYGLAMNDPSVHTFVGDANVYQVSANDMHFNPWIPPFETTYHERALVGFEDPTWTLPGGALREAANPFIVGKAVALTPAVSDDFQGQVRPQPASASANDIGADEVDETNTSSTPDWSVY